MWKTLLSLLFILCLNCGVLYAQDQKFEVSPLHRFMQENADSTFMFRYTSNWGSSRNYVLLSKKGNMVSSYIYRDIFTASYFRNVPDTIRKAIFEANKHRISSALPEINEKFEIYQIERDKSLKFWAEMMAVQPWSINDDKIDGAHCPKVKQERSVYDNRLYDGGGIELALITKNEIKMLEFYAPDFYEKQCPGRPGRIGILKIAALFNKYMR